MDAAAIKSHIAERITSARDTYINDLTALDHAALVQSPGGAARTPYDFTYEVVFVNRRITTRLKGGVPEAFDFAGWIVAPEEFCDKDVAIRELKASATEVLDAWNACADAELDTPIETPSGATSAIKVASLCATHMTYHDAQLNYLQALLGDDEMHWD